jgi:hypothetical protein
MPFLLQQRTKRVSKIIDRNIAMALELENRNQVEKEFADQADPTKFGMDWCGSSTPRTPEYRTMNE